MLQPTAKGAIYGIRAGIMRIFIEQSPQEVQQQVCFLQKHREKLEDQQAKPNIILQKLEDQHSVSLEDDQ